MFSALTATAALRICQKCGYEAAAGISSCSHCGSVLPVEKSEGASQPEIDIPRSKPDRLHGYLPTKHVEREIAKGEKVFKEKNYALSVYFLRNAAALNTLTEPSDGKKRSEKINKQIEYAEKKAGKVMKTCSACQGTGKATVYMRAASTEDGDNDSGRKKVTASYKKCQKCEGKGSRLQNLNMDVLQGKYGQAMGQYRKLQRAQRLSQVGNAWIDPEFAEKLSLEEEITLRQAAALPCEDCMGTGFGDCKKCNGSGTVDCNAEGCMDGYIESSSGSGLEGGLSSISRLENCSTCFGKGYIVCEACNGTGGKACKKCKGSGERDICSKCNGEGLIDCRKCKGTGVYKDDPCKYCDEKGVVRCTSCNGDGKRD